MPENWVAGLTNIEATADGNTTAVPSGHRSSVRTGSGPRDRQGDEAGRSDDDQRRYFIAKDIDGPERRPAGTLGVGGLQDRLDPYDGIDCNCKAGCILAFWSGGVRQQAACKDRVPIGMSGYFFKLASNAPMTRMTGPTTQLSGNGLGFVFLGVRIEVHKQRYAKLLRR